MHSPGAQPGQKTSPRLRASNAFCSSGVRAAWVSIDYWWTTVLPDTERYWASHGDNDASIMHVSARLQYPPEDHHAQWTRNSALQPPYLLPHSINWNAVFNITVYRTPATVPKQPWSTLQNPPLTVSLPTVTWPLPYPMNRDLLYPSYRTLMVSCRLEAMRAGVSDLGMMPTPVDTANEYRIVCNLLLEWLVKWTSQSLQNRISKHNCSWLCITSLILCSTKRIQKKRWNSTQALNNIQFFSTKIHG